MSSIRATRTHKTKPMKTFVTNDDSDDDFNLSDDEVNNELNEIDEDLNLSDSGEPPAPTKVKKKKKKTTSKRLRKKPTRSQLLALENDDDNNNDDDDSSADEKPPPPKKKTTKKKKKKKKTTKKKVKKKKKTPEPEPEPEPDNYGWGTPSPPPEPKKTKKKKTPRPPPSVNTNDTSPSNFSASGILLSPRNQVSPGLVSRHEEHRNKIIQMRKEKQRLEAKRRERDRQKFLELEQKLEEEKEKAEQRKQELERERKRKLAEGKQARLRRKKERDELIRLGQVESAKVEAEPLWVRRRAEFEADEEEWEAKRIRNGLRERNKMMFRHDPEDIKRHEEKFEEVMKEVELKAKKRNLMLRKKWKKNQEDQQRFLSKNQLRIKREKKTPRKDPGQLRFERQSSYAQLVRSTKPGVTPGLNSPGSPGKSPTSPKRKRFGSGEMQSQSAASSFPPIHRKGSFGEDNDGWSNGGPSPPKGSPRHSRTSAGRINSQNKNNGGKIQTPQWTIQILNGDPQTEADLQKKYLDVLTQHMEGLRP